MYNEKDVKKVQCRLLEMAIATRDILESNNIPYFIAYGTLLGAVRHKGFIPWDEDFDFILFDDTYDKASAVLSEKLPADMFLENDKTEIKYFHAWSHVKDLYSICESSMYPQDSVYVHRGLSLDLYKFSKMKQKEWPSFKYIEAIKYINRLLALGLIAENEYHKRKEQFDEYFDCINKTTPSTNQLIYGSSVSKHMFTLESIKPLRTIEFEGEHFSAPNNPDIFLKECYGDYMSLPPLDQRVGQFSKVIFK